MSKSKSIFDSNTDSLLLSIKRDPFNTAWMMPQQPILDLVQQSNLMLSKYEMPFAARIAIESVQQSYAPTLKFLESWNSTYAAIADQFKQNETALIALDIIQKQTFPFQIAQNQFANFQNQINFVTTDVLNGLTRTVQDLFPSDYFIKVRLRSQYWLIMDSVVLDKINDLSPAYEEMGQVVVEYYKENSWKKLEDKVESWKPYISERIELFSAFLYLTKEITSGESHKATVPAIIAQIDGLIRELRSLLPNEAKARIQQEILANLPEDLKGKKVDTRNEVAVQVVAEVVDFWSAEMLQEIIFEGLFRDSKDIDSEGSYLLFRHKILHGDPSYLSYGTEENFVRLMLYVDFLVHLIAYFRGKRPALSSSQEGGC